jgi:membrane protein DedA with SNARE-associated domain
VSGFLEDYGLIVLFAIIGLQALGVPGLPGKTALVTAAILAADDRFAIRQVITVAAVAVIAGGYVGYLIGRVGGRGLVERTFLAERLEQALALADSFFDRHGSKAVFLARFFPGVKVVVAPAAGIARMRWQEFAFWHALGGIGFALVFGLTAYYAGEGVIELAEAFGVYALIPLVAFAVLLMLTYKFLRNRRRLPQTHVAD